MSPLLRHSTLSDVCSPTPQEYLRGKALYKKDDGTEL